MHARHDDAELEKAETDPNYNGGLDLKLVRALRKVMNIIRNHAQNETQLIAFRGLNFEQLKGKRSHQHSLKLNDQWRLIVEIEKRPGPNNNVCVVKGIEDYH
jgi:proteic killer suppression protein